MKSFKKTKAKQNPKMDKSKVDTIEELASLFRQLVNSTPPSEQKPQASGKETFFLNFREDEDPRNFFKNDINELDPSIGKLEKKYFIATRKFELATGIEVEHTNDSQAAKLVKDPALFSVFMDENKIQNANKHLEKYYAAATGYNFTIRQMIMNFGITLKGDAQAWYQKVKPSITDHNAVKCLTVWRKFQVDFQNRFDCLKSNQDILTTIQNRKKEPNESVKDYAKALEELYNELSTVISTEEQMFKFYTGFNDETAAMIRCMNLKNFVDVHQNIKILQAIIDDAEKNKLLHQRFESLASYLIEKNYVPYNIIYGKPEEPACSSNQMEPNFDYQQFDNEQDYPPNWYEDNQNQQDSNWNPDFNEIDNSQNYEPSNSKKNEKFDKRFEKNRKLRSNFIVKKSRRVTLVHEDLQICINKSFADEEKCIWVEAYFENGKPIKCLIDCGSQRTMMRADLIPINRIDRNKTNLISSMDGESTESEGTAQMIISVENQCEVMNIMVNDKIIEDMVLGADFLHKFDITTNFREGSVKKNGEDIKFVTKHNEVVKCYKASRVKTPTKTSHKKKIKPQVSCANAKAENSENFTLKKMKPKFAKNAKKNLKEDIANGDKINKVDSNDESQIAPACKSFRRSSETKRCSEHQEIRSKTEKTTEQKTVIQQAENGEETIPCTESSRCRSDAVLTKIHDGISANLDSKISKPAETRNDFKSVVKWKQSNPLMEYFHYALVYYSLILMYFSHL